MHPLTRHGFTLVELLVVTVLLTIILGAIYESIAATQRLTATQVQRIEVQQTSRAAALYLTHVLRELDAADGDISVAAPTALRVRAMRWAGVLCTPPVDAGDVVLVTRAGLLFGLRAPDAALDSILLFRDGDTGTRGDDRWLVGSLQGSAAGTCADGTPGISLRVQIAATSGGNASTLVGVTVGSPLRGFQVEELSLSGDTAGNSWLGQRTADGAGAWSEVRPLIGPLTADGLAFAYFAASGAAAAQPTEIASVGLVVRGRSRVPVRQPGSGMDYLRDSVLTRVALRNNVRF